MKQQEFTAKTQNGTEVSFWAEIAEDGKVTTEYQIQLQTVVEQKGNRNIPIDVAYIAIPREQAEQMFGKKIDKKYKFACLQIADQDAWKAFEGEAKAIRKQIKHRECDRAMQAEIIGFTCERGCDAPDHIAFRYNFPEGLGYDAKAARKDADKNLAERVAKKVFDSPEGYEQIPSTFSTYGGWKLTKHQVLPIMSAALNELTEEKLQQEAKIAEENAKRDAIFQKAKDTGKQQALRTYMDECNPREECSQDAVTVWAMPDGSTKEERQHTW